MLNFVVYADGKLSRRDWQAAMDELAFEKRTSMLIAHTVILAWEEQT